jgi:hypothetical protein
MSGSEMGERHQKAVKTSNIEDQSDSILVNANQLVMTQNFEVFRPYLRRMVITYICHEKST